MVEGQPVASPVAGEKAVGPRGDSGGPRGIDAGRHAEGGADLLDQRGFFQLCLLYAREKLCKLARAPAEWPRPCGSAAKARVALTTSSM